MIKRFVGIGENNGQTTSYDVGSKTVVVVDHSAKPPLGNLASPQQVKTIVDSPKSIPVPGRLTSIGKVGAPQFTGPTSFEKDIRPQTYSRRSVTGPFETLFHKFRLEAIPFYNFWTPDETTNDQEDRGDRKLDDIPRFVKVAWDVAPDLAASRLHARNVSTRDIRAVRFGTENEKNHPVLVRGMMFSPEHLQSDKFSAATQNASNGHLSPGVVSARLEIDKSDVSAGSDMDEDLFLSATGIDGLSIEELRANMLAAGAPTVRSKDGQTVSLRVANSMLEMSISDGDGPSLSVSSRVPTVSGPKLMNSVDVLRERLTNPIDHQDKGSSVRVSFVDTSLGGSLDEGKLSLMSRPHHAEFVVAMAHVLPNLEVLARSGIAELSRRADIPSFPSPAGMPELEYVGYVLEKYRRSNSGVFELAETIELPNREYGEYIDCRVVYGETYRYRIRSVLRWTRPTDIGPYGPADLTISRIGSQTAKLVSHLSSYFVSEWNERWAYSSVIDVEPPFPPDELTVRPESSRKRVVVTFRLPDNSQRDISTMVLYRKLQSLTGEDLSSWEQILTRESVDRGVDFAPQNVLFYDYDVEYVQVSNVRYVYAAQTFSRHGEISALSEQLAVRISSEHVYRGELPVQFVSCAGVRLSDFGSFSTNPRRVFSSEVILKDRAKLSVRGGRSNRERDDSVYLLRTQSLDTGEIDSRTVSIRYEQHPAVPLSPTTSARSALGSSVSSTQTVEPPSPALRPPPSGRF